MLESQVQTAIFKWVELNTSKYPKLCLLFAVPNGGTRNKIEAVNLKRQGVRKGIPDMILPVARGGYSFLAIELKTEKGILSIEQKMTLLNFNNNGAFAVCCKSFEETIECLLWYINMPDTFKDIGNRNIDMLWKDNKEKISNGEFTYNSIN